MGEGEGGGRGEIYLLHNRNKVADMQRLRPPTIMCGGEDDEIKMIIWLIRTTTTMIYCVIWLISSWCKHKWTAGTTTLSPRLNEQHLLSQFFNGEILPSTNN